MAEVPGAYIAREFLGQKAKKGDDIGLFDHLRSADPIPPEDHVHRHRSAGIFGKIDVFELAEARELLEQPGCDIKAGRHRRGRARPSHEFVIIERQAGREGLPSSGPTLAEQ